MSSSPPPPQPPEAPAAPPRKFPAPCWTHEETLTLITSYKEKWYSLRRRNLRAADWDAVAAAVNSQFPHQNPLKTSAQCRHKMEKLRKRHRTEKQRAVALPHRRFFCSSWVFFDLMEDLESGSSLGDESKADLSKNNHTQMGICSTNFSYDSKFGKIDLGYDLKGANFKGKSVDDDDDGLVVPFKFKHKNSGSPLDFASKLNAIDDDDEDEFSGGFKSAPKPPEFNRKPNSFDGFCKRSSSSGAVEEMVGAIKAMAEGYVKMEKKKMEMVREIEQMQMEMEMKRNEMVIESQQMIINAFVEGFLEKKKNNKKMKVNGVKVEEG